MRGTLWCELTVWWGGAVFDLVEGKNTELTEAKIAQYRMQNEDQIAANQAKQVNTKSAPWLCLSSGFG